MKKLMEEVSPLLTGNGRWNILREKSRGRNFKCKTREAHDHTGDYLWDEDDKTDHITSDNNNTIVDTGNDKYEVETDKN